MTQAFLCPVDQTALVMSERQGIEIDYCPTCRGVWLDRGELDKIIEKNATVANVPQPAAADSRPTQRQDSGHWAQPRQSEPHSFGSKPHKRRGSFLEELFD